MCIRFFFIIAWPSFAWVAISPIAALSPPRLNSPSAACISYIPMPTSSLNRPACPAALTNAPWNAATFGSSGSRWAFLPICLSVSVMRAVWMSFGQRVPQV